MQLSLFRHVAAILILYLATNFLVPCLLCPSGGTLVFPRAPSAADLEHCVTPSGSPGNCILISRCRRLWNSRDFQLLRQSLCGFDGEAPKVCCPASTTALPTRRPSPITRATPLPLSTSSRSVRRPLTGRLPVTLTTSASRHGVRTSPPTRSPATTPGPLSTSAPSREARKPDGAGVDDATNPFPKECGKNKATFRRIVGGQESAVGAWPWMAAIYFNRRGIKNNECGGALITEKHVLTAAHCLVDSKKRTVIDPKVMIVRLGDHDLESDDDGAQPVNVSVKSVLSHEGFDPRTFQNDIAIMELASPVRFENNIRPICLPLKGTIEDDVSDKNAFVAGWGTLSFNGQASSKLQEVQLRIWENADCKEQFKKEAPITDVNVCAGDGDKDSCRGDSGGPLMLPHRDQRFYLIGIVSFGKKCAEPGYPGVYTRITSFINWILEKVKETS